MKIIKLLLIFSLFLSVHSLNAQTDGTWNQKDKNGLKTGKWRGLHKNGRTRYEGQFIDGKPYDVFRYFFDTGEIKTVMKYKNPKEAYATHFYQNGDYMATGKFLNQLKDSIWTTFGADNIKLQIGAYLSGRKYGLWTTYYQNGQVSDEMHFEGDLEQGTYKRFYANGTLKQESIYEQGVLEGLSTFYSGQGKKTAKGLYVRGYRNGHWVFYDDKQQVKTVLRYEIGKLLNPEDLEKDLMEEDDMNEFKKNRKEALEYDDLRGTITYD